MRQYKKKGRKYYYEMRMEIRTSLKYNLPKNKSTIKYLYSKKNKQGKTLVNYTNPHYYYFKEKK